MRAETDEWFVGPMLGLLRLVTDTVQWAGLAAMLSGGLLERRVARRQRCGRAAATAQCLTSCSHCRMLGSRAVSAR